MKKVGLYVIGFLFVCGVVLYGIDSLAYSETGHEDFKKIVFVDEGKLIKDYSEKDIDEAFDEMSGKVFGWQTTYFNVDQKATYEGITVFARSNQTTKKYDFEYVLKETETTQTSVTIKGSVSVKITGTINKIKTGFTGTADVSGQHETKNTYTSDAKTTISLSILPNTKVSMIITGDAYVTNGISRYTFLGITFRKGTWERIETDTIYYEVREEKIK